MGTLCIGLKYPGYIAAGVSYLNVIINFCILSYNPEVRQQYLEQNEKYRLKPGKKSAAQKIVDYGIENPEHAKNAARIIAENPEAAQKAAKFASENPELAKAALDSAV